MCRRYTGTEWEPEGPIPLHILILVSKNGIRMARRSYIDAISSVKNEVHISIRVNPSRGTDVIRGFDPWRSRIIVDVSEAAAHGKANRKLIAFFTTLFPDSTAVELLSGEKSRDKKICVRGPAPPKII